MTIHPNETPRPDGLSNVLVCPMYICPGLNRDEIKFNSTDEKANFMDEVCKRGQYDCSCSYFREHKGEERLVGVTI